MLTSKNEASSFKKLIHKNNPTIFMAIKNGDSKTLYGTYKNCWRKLRKLNDTGHEIFMAINTMRGTERNAESCTNINALFIDYDKGDWSTENIDEFLKKFPVKPHLVVETSPGNYHVYWRVDAVPLEAFKEMQQNLAAKFGSDKAVCDPARVMRMPGTYNHKIKHQDKHGEPFLTKIVYIDKDDAPIPYEQFVSKMFGNDGRIMSTAALKSSTKAEVGKVSKGNIRIRVDAALKLIPADDRREWVTVGMALKSEFGEDGLPIFIEWSKSSPKYDDVVTLQQWASFKADGGVKVATLFWLAKTMNKPINSNDKMIAAITTTLELAEHFAATLNERLSHCEEDKSWYVYLGGKWERSNKRADRAAIEYMQAMKVAVAKSDNDNLRSLVERGQSAASARELLRTVESDPALSIKLTAFDSIPNHIGVKLPAISEGIERYGVINLKSHKFKYALPKDMVLKVAGAVYDPDATCELWDEFIKEITLEDSDLAEFLQLAVGYTLYGHTDEQVMFILIGSGGNGKGVFSRIIYALLGDYSALMQSNLLKPGAINANSPSPALMKLESKRLWVCSEMPKGMVLDEALTKQITGGDLIGSRQLYGNQVEFLPKGKLWVSVNDMPRVRHDDNGMWRRFVPIPFNAVFKGSKRDNELESKLKAELSGILNWALEGARKYAENGSLGRPSASKILLNSLRRDVDTVGIWIKTRCVPCADTELQSMVAYDDYRETMKLEKTSPLPQKEFKADMIKRGYEHKQTRKYNSYVGLALKAD